MRTKCHVVAIPLIAVALSIAFYEGAAALPPIEDAIAECEKGSPTVLIRSRDPFERAAADTCLKLRRRRTIHSLASIARSAPEEYHLKSAKLLAVQILGEYRAAEAVPALAQQIDYSPPSLIVTAIHPLNKYPAALALVRIGVPAYEGIFSRLAHPVTEHELRLFAFVALDIDGREVGLYRLEQKLKDDAAQGFEGRRENLTRLINLYKSTDATDPKDWP